MAFHIPIECFRGEALTLADVILGSGSIAAWTLTFALKLTHDASTTLVTKTVGSGITITDAAARTFTVSLTAANTNQTAGKYVYTIARTNSGAETVLTYGEFTIHDNSVF